MTSAALLKRRDPADALQLCVLELFAHEVRRLSACHAAARLSWSSAERAPDLLKEVPLMRLDALPRELGPRSPGADAWGGVARE